MPIRTVRPAFVFGLAGALVCAPSQAPAGLPECLDRSPVARHRLPASLREVSGLALGDDGRLWLHNDELAMVGAIDAATGRPLGSYRLGPALVRDDFEGVATTGNRLFLITSAGRLWSATLPPNATPDGSLAVDILETGIGAQCEIEGLAFEPRGRILLVACKSPRAQSLEKRVTIFRWSIDAKRLATPDRISLPLDDFAKGRKGRGFHPSAIDRDPVSGQYLLLASADQAFAVIDPAGTVTRVGSLARRHRQPEGLAVGANGMVYVADEGGNGPGTITVYGCR